MEFRYRIWLENNGKAFGKGPYELLKAVASCGSLNQAARLMGMSYSKAWRILNTSEDRLGFKLLLREAGGSGGGGSCLTPEALDLLKRYEGFTGEARGMLEALFHKYFGQL